MKSLNQCISKKELLIARMPHVTGSVCVHFPNPEVKDIQLKTDDAVNVFNRINITVDDVKKSNIQSLLNQGLIRIV